MFILTQALSLFIMIMIVISLLYWALLPAFILSLILLLISTIEVNNFRKEWYRDEL